MKAVLNVSEKLQFEVSADSQKDLFEQFSSIQEIFANSTCGKCGSTNVRFQVRDVDDNKYYEMVCQEPKCRAKLAFGSHKKGNTLFPRRKDENGNWLENRGWVQFKPADKDTPF